MSCKGQKIAKTQYILSTTILAAINCGAWKDLSVFKVCVDSVFRLE